MRFDRVTERPVGQDPILVLTPDFFTFDVPCGLQVGDDPLHGAFGNPDLLCHLAKDERRTSCKERQDVRVVRQKRPVRTSRVC